MIAAEPMTVADPPSAALVDDRCGVVSRPEPGPGPWPLGAEVPRVRARLHLPGASVTVAGCALGDPQAAYDACVGEAAERYAAMVPRTPDVLASTAELRETRVDHLDPAALGAEPVPAGHRPIGWLRSADDRLVPSNAVLGHLSGVASPATEGVYPQGSTGLAAARSRTAAVAAGCAEVIERDAMARAWAGTARVGACALPDRLARLGESAGLTAAPLVIGAGGSGSRVSVVALRHRAYGLLGTGAAYRTDPIAGLTKAWLEAVVSLAQARELADPETGPALCAAAGLGPWRADRRYAAGGWEPVRNLAEHVALLLDPTAQEQVWQRLTLILPRSGEPIPAESLPTNEPPEPLARRLFGEVVDVDLTPTDLAHLGEIVVVRVLAAGARVVRPAGLTPEELPCPLV